MHEYDFVPAVAEPGVRVGPLCVESMFIAAHPDAGSPDDDAALDRWRDAVWITARPGTLCHLMTVRACQAAGFTPRVRHRVDEFATVLAMVAAGLGVAMVPQLALAGRPDGVALSRLPIQRRTTIAHRTGADRHPAVVAVAAALRAAVPADLRAS